MAQDPPPPQTGTKADASDAAADTTPVSVDSITLSEIEREMRNDEIRSPRPFSASSPRSGLLPAREPGGPAAAELAAYISRQRRGTSPDAISGGHGGSSVGETSKKEVAPTDGADALTYSSEDDSKESTEGPATIIEAFDVERAVREASESLEQDVLRQILAPPSSPEEPERAVAELLPPATSAWRTRNGVVEPAEKIELHNTAALLPYSEDAVPAEALLDSRADVEESKKRTLQNLDGSTPTYADGVVVAAGAPAEDEFAHDSSQRGIGGTTTAYEVAPVNPGGAVEESAVSPSAAPWLVGDAATTIVARPGASDLEPQNFLDTYSHDTYEDEFSGVDPKQVDLDVPAAFGVVRADQAQSSDDAASMGADPDQWADHDGQDGLPEYSYAGPVEDVGGPGSTANTNAAAFRVPSLVQLYEQRRMLPPSAVAAPPMSGRRNLPQTSGRSASGTGDVEVREGQAMLR